MSDSKGSRDDENASENEINSSVTSKEAKDEKNGEIREQKDESDEDIPGDFFDDFLKEDFMAGLDIVDDDAWDEDKIKNEIEAANKTKQDADTSVSKQSTENSKKRKPNESSNKSRGKKGSPNSADKAKGKPKRKRHEEKKDDTKQKRNTDKKIDADEFDIRRDPEKTKRDIERDKVRCEKDKEMKIISEKLSMVETGLVPPGMEMELDIEEVKRQKEKIEGNSPRDLREHIKDLKERNRSPVPRVRSPIRRKSQPIRSPIVRKVSSPRRHSRSPRKDSLPLTRNAVSPTTRRSPRRSPLRRRLSRSPRRRSSERVRRRSRSHSPLFRSRRVKYSPHRRRDRSNSRESDREKWLKRRKRSRSPKKKKDEKKSFLQEIAEKLNETRQPVNVGVQLQPVQPILKPMQQRTLRYIQPLLAPVPAPAPVPVPPPNTGPVFGVPQSQQFDQYDQSFFIGTPQPIIHNNFPQSSPILQMPLNPNQIQPGSSISINPNSFAIPGGKISGRVANVGNKLQNQSRLDLQNQEDIAKLFQDKQITLSEFLAITAKPEVFSSSPIHLKEKVKVITRCHEAIKILISNEKKFSGKLVVQKTDKYKIPTGKYVSPLKITPPVQFPFTNLTVSLKEQKNGFSNFINMLLQKLGLLNDTVVNIDDEQILGTPVDQTQFCPPPPPLMSPIKNSILIEPRKMFPSKIPEVNVYCKMVQTDVFKCGNCEKRKKILYRTAASQTSDLTSAFSVSTQVSEDELQPKILSKTQSLAAMTPAQLLAKSRESLSAATRGGRIDVDNFDIHPSGYNRSNFYRPNDLYGMSRPNPIPFGNNSSIYDVLNAQMSGGGNRARESNIPRNLDPRNLDPRLNHNNYY